MQDRLIEQIGSNHKEVQETLRGKDETLTLDIVVDLAHTEEVTQAHQEQFADATAVYAVQPSNCRKDHCQWYVVDHSQGPRTKCPALGSMCDACSK